MLIYEYKMVKTRVAEDVYGQKISGDYDASKVAHEYYSHLFAREQEVFSIIMLNTKQEVIGIYEVSMGTLDSAIVHPRDVLKPLILASAAGYIAVHNHPSGNLNPSPEDYALTRRLKQASELVGIRLLDHLIINESGDTRSLASMGAI